MVVKVIVTETLERELMITAESLEEAKSKVNAKYRNEDIVLDADDFVGVTFEAEEYKEVAT